MQRFAERSLTGPISMLYREIGSPAENTLHVTGLDAARSEQPDRYQTVRQESNARRSKELKANDE